MQSGRNRLIAIPSECGQLKQQSRERFTSVDDVKDVACARALSSRISTIPGAGTVEEDLGATCELL